jgi:Spy/CpxP family protein refolding chaperone
MTMNRITSYSLSLMTAGALMLTAGTWTGVSAQDDGTQDNGGVMIDENADGIEDGFRKGRRGGRGGHRKGRAAGGAQLTDEQKAEVKALISGLKEDGATPEDVRAALDQFREANGIEAPDRGSRPGLNLDPEVKAQIEQLRADGATREEVRTALADQGVELPEPGERSNRRGGGHRDGGRRR